MSNKKKEWKDPIPYSSQGWGFIRVSKLRLYLGVWDGTYPMPREVNAQYLRYCLELEKQFLAGEGLHKPGEEEERVEAKIRDAAGKYLHHLQTSGSGYLRPDGTVSEEFKRAQRALEPLIVLYGDLWCHHFTIKDLEDLREAMYRGSWKKRPKAQPVPEAELKKKRRKGRPRVQADRPEKRWYWTWAYTNRMMRHVLAFWARCEFLRQVPPGTSQHFATMKKLVEEVPEDRGRVMVPDEIVMRVLEYTSPVVRAMAMLGRVTAMRPAEICRLNPAEIDQSQDSWVYCPKKHKTAYLKHRRLIPLGAEAQKILRPFMDRCQPEEYLFKPVESEAYFERLRQEQAGKNRQTPLYPSEIRRREKAKAKTKAQGSGRKRGAHFAVRSFRQAVCDAIERARRDHQEVEHWYPYLLRHMRLTEVQYEEGMEMAAALAGHRSGTITSCYTHRQDDRGLALAVQVQEPVIEPTTLRIERTEPCPCGVPRGLGQGRRDDPRRTQEACRRAK